MIAQLQERMGTAAMEDLEVVATQSLLHCTHRVSTRCCARTDTEAKAT